MGWLNLPRHATIKKRRAAGAMQEVTAAADLSRECVATSAITVGLRMGDRGGRCPSLNFSEHFEK